ncbi:FMN-binding glutamate synthase family protein [Paenibacillus albidus]|uniref:FMN-binding glutamate synthase family protein n=1 Tax=Paenibacillus albidus TaxID=2041023 RepID=A0A917CJQ9_9BACL|nr:FMN-binding glutamate synthase family protein [Paenibacillus albidus]GGF91000.1 FMN-binding glutamate synthase family protein [Paenibacillus albidus]
MFRWMIRKMTNGVMDTMADHYMKRMMQDPYTENVFSMFAIMQKLTPRAIIEAGIRAESGKVIERTLGSTIVLSDWHKILLNPVHMFRLPTQDDVPIQTGVTIGPQAKKPLNLEIPILISGMSYGGAISLKAKAALARGASIAGTATNSGEALFINEERREAKFFIGQYHRGGWMNIDESLRQLDAIEIQLGQGARAAAPSMGSHQIGEDLRITKKLKPGENSVIHSRIPGVNKTEDIISLVQNLKNKYGVPVGIKICATHFMERELDVAVQAGVDYFVVDGAEAGTQGGPTTLQDDVGLPTLFALARTVQYLEEHGVKQSISVIASGGLTTPGHFLKAMALGADAVYIGSIALIALLQTQIAEALPTEPPPQIPLYLGKLKEDLDVEKGAEHLANFLKSSVEEMKLVAYALGKTDLAQINKMDLVTVDRDLAQVLQIDYAGFPPGKQKPSPGANVTPGATEMMDPDESLHLQ